MRLIAINFHYVRENFEAPYPSIFGVTPKEFEEQIDAICQAASVVGSSDLLRALEGRQTLPDPAALVTFDDGLREQFDHAWPILKRKGIPALFFVNTGCIVDGVVENVHKAHILRSQVSPASILADLDRFLEKMGRGVDVVCPQQVAAQYPYDRSDAAAVKYALNMRLTSDQLTTFLGEAMHAVPDFDEQATSRSLYMSTEQLQELDAAESLGSHAHQHVPLGRQAPPSLEYQIRESRRLLALWGCPNVFGISYPHGSFEACSALCGQMAVRQGFRFGLTMERAVNVDLENPMFLARISNSDLVGRSVTEVLQNLPKSTWHRV
ncbi:MAG: hypothetical protein FJX65_03985 [Alphaproteobacteria bacterium]|nr:hypothetical protein [Alphaproteobacteria bacterium]